MSDPINKRDAFRLDDTLRLSTKLLTDEEINAIELDFNTYRLKHCLKSHLHLQRENRKAMRVVLSKRMPEVANYLSLLEDDLLLIAGRLGSESERPESDNLTNVNLSRTSVRIDTTDRFELEQRVELFMNLSTGGTNILLIAKVVRVEPFESGSRVSLLFVTIHPDDEEAIIRHMAKLQQLHLQARRTS